MRKTNIIIDRLLVVCVVMFLFLAACGSQNNPENYKTTLQSEGTVTGKMITEEAKTEDTKTEDTIESDALFTIFTEDCDLKYPEKWQPFINTTVMEGVPYAVKFSHIDGTPLFDIVFGEETGTLLGTVTGKHGDVTVSYVGYELDENNVNYYDQVGMQDSANTLFQNLKHDYMFVDEYPFTINNDSSKVFAIKTSITTLYYPEKWEDVVTVNVDKKNVSFYYGEILLFEIRFKECDGVLLGKYGVTPVYAVMQDIKSDGFSVKQYRDICAMQDDLNVILEHLKQDTQFR